MRTEFQLRSFIVAVITAALLSTALAGQAQTAAAPSPAAQASGQAETPALGPQQSAADVLLGIVAARAQELAKSKYVPLRELDSEVLRKMSYSQYRAINFKAEHALWYQQSPFEIQFFHPGFLYRHPVTVREVSNDGVMQKVDFDPARFDYRAAAKDVAAQVQGNPGYAGFRVHYPLNRSGQLDEVAVFQGASYFRVVGPGQVYGLSARGLAIDTAASSGEEFPAFRDFWLQKPDKGASELVIYALLDSPSVAGAYRFVLEPSVSTQVQVEAVLYPRENIQKLGIAPLTSMFHHGENTTRYVDDFRPEVHDSDGLLMHTSHGEWIWRPLTNPAALQVVSFSDVSPKGFGLLQRDRDFNHYLDGEAYYGRRPSMWVAPKGDWGEGRVELVEIPSNSETNDNIVAYWVPQRQILAGQEYRFSYTLSTFGARLAQQTLGQVLRTRIGWAALPGEDNPPPADHRQFAIDFSGGALADLPSTLQPEALLELSSGKTTDVQVRPLPEKGQWRVSFKLIPEGDKPVDMRLTVALRGHPITEVWNYVWLKDALAR